MATNFVLELDTTSPQGVAAAIDGGAPYATSRSVVLAVTSTSTDVALMKVWGDVDPTADPNIQATEGASSYFTYNPSLPLSLSTGDGSKTLHTKLADDVGNANATATDASITLDTTSPVPTVTATTTPRKISKVASFDTYPASFAADSAIQAWKWKVVPSASSLHSAGTTIPTTGGSTNTTGTTLAASTSQAVSIKGADLETASAGDGNKIVKVFVQDLAGLWSI